MVKPRRAVRGVVVIVGSVALIGLSGLIYLGGGAPQQEMKRGTVSHGLSPLPRNGACPTNQLKLTGVFNQCVAIQDVLNCPRSFEQSKVVHLHGAHNDFLLYVEIIGAYHGPGTYQLRPWPHPGLGLNDGVAKVAVREYDSGQMWQSSTGYITVDNTEDGGWVLAGLGQDPMLATDLPADLDLNLAGWWTCA